MAGNLMRKLFPRKGQFYDLLEESTRNLADAVQLLTSLARQSPGEDRNAAVSRVKELEHNGDRITRQIYSELGKTFITPIDSEDIHGLASALDDVMDRIEGIATRVRLYNIVALPPSFHEMISILFKAVEHLNSVIPQLRDLHRARSLVVERCSEMHHLENEGDHIYHETIGQLFAGQDGLLENLKLKEIVMGLEAAVDSCERVANRVENVVLKYA
jgi:predicted phosphate transport protein (TIGR00153 family)